MFEDTNYYADEQCQSWADYLLRQNTILQSSLNITTVLIYHLEVNKLIRIPNEKKNYEREKYLINSLSIPLGIGQISMSVISANELEAVYLSSVATNGGV